VECARKTSAGSGDPKIVDRGYRPIDHGIAGLHPLCLPAHFVRFRDQRNKSANRQTSLLESSKLGANPDTPTHRAHAQITHHHEQYRAATIVLEPADKTHLAGF
jgi:hypothetical protein